jgi:alkanesulfonate monooxygenase SsuD/methylene tetrahydromethanopterin reductase-like flavin-dependent oxidoreductase (luciferase family)
VTGEVAPPLHFGLQLVAVHGAGVAPQQQLREHEELASMAEQLGFDMLSTGQHFLSAELRYYQPLLYLLRVGKAAPRLRLCTSVLLAALLNPVQAAEDIATFDALNGGRTIVGVGLGYADREYAAFGVRRGVRGQRLEEALEVLRRTWAGDERGFAGEHFSFPSLLTATLPLQTGGPAVWVGAQTPVGVQRAARVGDAWLASPLSTHAELRRLHRTFLMERERTARPAPAVMPVIRDLAVADDPATALRLAAGWSADRFAMYRRWGMQRELGTEGLSASPDTLAQRFILGDPQGCAEAILALRRDIDMTHLVLKPQWPGLHHRDAMRQLERFGEDILPILATAGT